MAIKTADRAAFWQRHRENFQASGLTRRAYCREHGLKLHQLGYQLDRAKKVTSGKAVFARVVTAAPVAVTRRGTARLSFGGGVVLEIDAGSDPTWIAQVIAAVGDRQ